MDTITMMIPIVRNIAGRYTIREDLFSVGMAAVITAGAAPPGTVSEKAWFITVARNAIIDYLRRYGDSVQPWDEQYDPDWTEPVILEDEAATIDRLCKLISQDTVDEAILAGRLAGDTDSTIAERCGTSQQFINQKRHSLGTRLQRILGFNNHHNDHVKHDQAKP